MLEALNKTGNVGIARLNCLHPPFDKVEARQAMLYLLNQSDFLKATFGNPKYYQTCPSYFGCGTPMQTDANTDWFKHGVDLAKAKAMFEQVRLQGRAGGRAAGDQHRLHEQLGAVDRRAVGEDRRQGAACRQRLGRRGDAPRR